MKDGWEILNLDTDVSDNEFWLRAKFVKKHKFYDTKRICVLPFPIVEDSVQIVLHSVVKKPQRPNDS